MTLISQDDHLTTGAWTACGLTKLFCSVPHCNITSGQTAHITKHITNEPSFDQVVNCAPYLSTLFVTTTTFRYGGFSRSQSRVKAVENIA